MINTSSLPLLFSPYFDDNFQIFFLNICFYDVRFLLINAYFQCQGVTVYKPNEIQADLNETFQAAMCYVILSRVMCIQQLFLLPFDQSKIYCNENAKLEAEKLKENALNRRVTKWDTDVPNIFKISSLNIRSLQKHFIDFQNDLVLQKSDIICIYETWLVQNLEPFDNYHSFYINSKSKGMALLSKLKPEIVEKYEYTMASFIVASYKMFDVISVYKFAEFNQIDEFIEEIAEKLNLSKTIVICGDMNLDLIKHPSNKFTTYLLQLGFNQLVNTSTHILGGIIDHVYFYSPDNAQCTLYDIHPLYYSDHDAVSFLLDVS